MMTYKCDTNEITNTSTTLYAIVRVVRVYICFVINLSTDCRVLEKIGYCINQVLEKLGYCINHHGQCMFETQSGGKHYFAG